MELKLQNLKKALEVQGSRIYDYYGFSWWWIDPETMESQWVLW